MIQVIQLNRDLFKHNNHFKFPNKGYGSAQKFIWPSLTPVHECTHNLDHKNRIEIFAGELTQGEVLRQKLGYTHSLIQLKTKLGKEGEDILMKFFFFVCKHALAERTYILPSHGQIVGLQQISEVINLDDLVCVEKILKFNHEKGCGLS